MLTFQPLIWSYPHSARSGCTVIPVPSTANEELEQYVHQSANKLKNFDVRINSDLSSQLHNCLKERLRKAQKQQLRLTNAYLNEVKQLSKVSPDIPRDLLNQIVKNRLDLAMNDITNELTENLEDLTSKARFIHDLERRKFHYCNVAEYDPNKFNNEQTLERMLIRNNPHHRILCSNDIFNHDNQSKLAELFHQLTDERKTNRKLNLIYADFSYCSYKLLNMMILPSKRNTIERSPILERKTSSNVINVLLLGETGVGKSTFINAFVNYLTFDTMKQAETNTPVTVMPVSFLMTTGHNFDEHLVKFGDFNNSNNEDFDHPGQSVTQHCKSYLFNLDRTNKNKKLCIIDTPGFGDTRGLDQDDLNMQHILKYIHNQTHLNAICFLLKPNSSRLHTFFRTCLTQLLDLLGPNARQNIIFCFTNARSTFYTPGDTAPLLQTMLNSSSPNDIPFNKENTFCFDNESFRYLVALQNRIKFNNEEKHEYEISWSTSVNESRRLINYITTQLREYSFHHGQQSIKHAEIEIISMIRPMLESMRNILRNLILWEKVSPSKSIELKSKTIHRPSAFCYSCKRDPFPLGKFWILPDHPHILGSTCLTCSCASNQHISIDYILSYDLLNNSSDYQPYEMNDILNRLCLTSAEFAYFLGNITHSKKEEDPFRSGLMQMITEEKQICAEQESNQLNLQLVEDLKKLLINYEEHMKKIQLNKKQKDLQGIYESIKTICEYQPINEQMAAIRQKGEQPKDKPYNFDVSEDLTHRETGFNTGVVKISDI